MKGFINFIKEFWFVILMMFFLINWTIFYIYTDIRAKWNLAHIKNCPCLQEVANGSKN